MAVALTGEAPAAFTCRLAGFAGPIPAPSALPAAATQEMGSNLLGVPLDSKAGWVVADWLVAHSWRYHVLQVSFGSRTWTEATGRWAQSGAVVAGPATVRYQ